MTVNVNQSESQQTKIFISAASAVLVAALIWVGSTLTNNQIALSKLQIEIVHLRTEVQRANDDTKEFQTLTSKNLRDLEIRVNRLEMNQ